MEVGAARERVREVHQGDGEPLAIGAEEVQEEEVQEADLVLVEVEGGDPIQISHGQAVDTVCESGAWRY